MGAKFLLKPTAATTLPSLSPAASSSSSSSKAHQYHTYKRFLPVICSKPISKKFWLPKTNGFATLPAPVYGDDLGAKKLYLEKLKGKLEELGIQLDNFCPGQHNNLLCPMCNGGESEEKSFSLFISPDGMDAAWICFRAKCGWHGGTKPFAGRESTYESSIQPKQVKLKRDITVEGLDLQPLCGEALTKASTKNNFVDILIETLSKILGFFAERLISAETLQRNCVMQKSYGNQIVIAFTYWRNGELISCKYRDISKKFWQESDTERIFYGLDDIKGAADIIIVEGEMDKLAMEEAGFRNCVSVPDGAPGQVSLKELPTQDKDTKYQYLWNCKEYLDKASRIILATDGDPPGQALAEELARRLGRERCWRVKWPKKTKDKDYKDANEVLMFMGPDALRAVIENAELYPIRGLFNFREYFDEVDAYYYQTFGDEFGESTGWGSLDGLYNVVPGELTVVTGVPNSGKSEWIDALLCNLNRSAGWKFVLCSMENRVREHARKLLEKHIKKPFFDARYASATNGHFVQRMSVEEFEEGKQWLADTFYLIRCEDDKLPNVDWVLKLARAAVLRHGVRGLLIDPYNELDHQRPISMTETEYVSRMLTMVKRFAQHHACHVWFVAHPRQLHSWVGAAPNLYDISGSAHFINKCDNGIVVHRNRNPEAGPIDQVQICVRKVRNKVIGTIGDAFLSYNRVTGEYSDADTSEKK